MTPRTIENSSRQSFACYASMDTDSYGTYSVADSVLTKIRNPGLRLDTIDTRCGTIMIPSQTIPHNNPFLRIAFFTQTK